MIWNDPALMRRKKPEPVEPVVSLDPRIQQGAEILRKSGQGYFATMSGGDGAWAPSVNRFEVLDLKSSTGATLPYIYSIPWVGYDVSFGDITFTLKGPSDLYVDKAYGGGPYPFIVKTEGYPMYLHNLAFEEFVGLQGMVALASTVVGIDFTHLYGPDGGNCFCILDIVNRDGTVTSTPMQTYVEDAESGNLTIVMTQELCSVLCEQGCGYFEEGHVGFIN